MNNAGVARDGVLGIFGDDDVDAVIDLNLKATIQVTRLVVRQMLLGEGGGRIINISSIVGLSGYRGLSVYGATKAALDGFTRALARELGGRGITVNSIAPGYLRTEMTHGLDEAQLARSPAARRRAAWASPPTSPTPIRFLAVARGRLHHRPRARRRRWTDVMTACLGHAAERVRLRAGHQAVAERAVVPEPLEDVARLHESVPVVLRRGPRAPRRDGALALARQRSNVGRVAAVRSVEVSTSMPARGEELRVGRRAAPCGRRRTPREAAASGSRRRRTSSNGIGRRSTMSHSATRPPGRSTRAHSDTSRARVAHEVRRLEHPRPVERGVGRGRCPCRRAPRSGRGPTARRRRPARWRWPRPPRSW